MDNQNVANEEQPVVDPNTPASPEELGVGQRQSNEPFSPIDFDNIIDGAFANLTEQKAEEDYSERGQFAKQWGWYTSIYAVAKGDITKFDEVTGYGLHQCLTYLSFEKQKTEIEQREFNNRMKK